MTSTREGSLSDVFWQLCSGRYMYCNHVTAVFSLLYLPFAPKFVMGEAKACTRVVLRCSEGPVVYFHEFPTIYASSLVYWLREERSATCRKNVQQSAQQMFQTLGGRVCYGICR